MKKCYYCGTKEYVATNWSQKYLYWLSCTCKSCGETLILLGRFKKLWFDCGYKQDDTENNFYEAKDYLNEGKITYEEFCAFRSKLKKQLIKKIAQLEKMKVLVEKRKLRKFKGD